MITRPFACNINQKYTDVSEIMKFTEKFIERVYIEKRWGHLNECQAYNVDLDFKNTVSDPSALFMNRFNKFPDKISEPEWDYFGIRGQPLLEMLPEWKEKVRLFNELGLSQLVDSPCILVTNRQVVIHRDGRPDAVPGYTNRHCGINYLLLNNSPYLTGVWADTDASFRNEMEGIEHTVPDALIEYDSKSMNLVNTSLPHGSYINPNILPPAMLSPRAFITMGFTCSYAEAREKLSMFVNKDW